MPSQVVRLAVVAFALAITTVARGKGSDWKGLAAQPDVWYRSEQGTTTAAHVLANQAATGSWPKNVDTTRPATGANDEHGTFDNGATIGEVRFLTRAFRVTGKIEYRDAVVKAVDHVLAAQYPTGGWPQFHPPGAQYHRHITFNDNANVNLMDLLREASTSDDLLNRLPNLRLVIASARFARYHHPSIETVTRLRARGVPLLRTEDWGSIALQL